MMTFQCVMRQQIPSTPSTITFDEHSTPSVKKIFAEIIESFADLKNEENDFN